MTPDELRQAQDLAAEHADEIIGHEMLGREIIDTDNRPTATYDRRLTAYNESAHAVTVILRGGTFSSITIEPDGDRNGSTDVTAAAYDLAFVTFAGPWAEARAQWTQPLDSQDDDGAEFGDYVARAFEHNAGGDLDDYLRLAGAGAAVFGANTWLTFASERRWSRELESKWPVIRKVAELLIGGADVTAEMVWELLDDAET